MCTNSFLQTRPITRILFCRPLLFLSIRIWWGASYGHYFLQMSEQAIEPLGECRPNVEVFRGLAERMGFEDECFRETVDSMIEGALASANPRLAGITRERLEREHRVRLNLEALLRG